MMYPQKNGNQGWGRALLLLCALLFVFAIAGGSLTFAQSVLAQAPTAQPQEEAPAGATPVTPDEVNNVARELWCPLCSGVRLDACELKACEQMRDVIAVKLTEGEDTETIKAYFVEQYGPQVMGEPPRQGFNWLAWLLPAAAAVVGGYFFWRTTQRMMQPVAPLADDSGTELPANTSFSNTPVTLDTTVEKPLTEEDEYSQKLDEELAKYG
jgi:cytochrome c-type biogenesis protein CcmH/NrfF